MSHQMAWARMNAPRWRESASSHASSSRCSASPSSPRSIRITQRAAMPSKSSLPMTVFMCFYFGLCGRCVGQLHFIHEQAQRLHEVFLDRALRQMHAFGDFLLRQLRELAQLEGLAALGRQLSQHLLHALDLFATADAALDADILIGKVERIDIGDGLDGDDAQSAQGFSDDMPGGDEEVGA